MISKKVFSADGTITRFLSDFLIRSDQFARPYVYIYDETLASDGSEDVLQDGTTLQSNWSYPDNLWKRGTNSPASNDLTTSDKWQVVDNSILYYVAPLAGTIVWVEVATTAEEFGDTLTQPSYQNIKESEWVGTAAKMTADSYATQPEDEFVIEYTSNKDGTYIGTPTTEYSALHWAAKADESSENAINNTLNSVDSIADMLLADVLVTTSLNVKGYTTKGDGGGGIFNYDATQSATNNGGTIIDGWVRQYSGAVNVKWFGASTSRIDNEVAINAAISIADGVSALDIDCGGETYTISDSVVITERYVTLNNIHLVADASWTNDFLDYTDMGTAEGGESVQQKLNRGHPMISIIRDNTSYTGADFKDITIKNFSLDGNNVAPGICMTETRTSKVYNGKITYCNGYGLAMLVKNTEAKVYNINISEDVWGGAKYLNPALYSSAGFVETCADLLVTNLVCNYAEYPIWADGFYSTQWTNIHVYNGNGIAAALPNIYIGPDAHAIMTTNIYNDNGYVEMHSFDNSFIGGRLTRTSASSNLKFALLVAQQAGDDISGLIITDMLGPDASTSTVVQDTTTVVGSSFTTINNSKIEALTRSSSAVPLRTGYTHNKTLSFLIASASWVADGAFWKYEFDYESSIAFPTVETQLTITVNDTRTVGGLGPLNTSARYIPNGGIGTKKVTIYADTNAKCTVYLGIQEGAKLLT